jgi:hypothetical protein
MIMNLGGSSDISGFSGAGILPMRPSSESSACGAIMKLLKALHKKIKYPDPGVPGNSPSISLDQNGTPRPGRRIRHHLMPRM